MRNDIENIIRNVTNSMAEVLDDEQLQKLQNVLYIQFHGLKFEEENTQLITSESGWQKILKLYAAVKDWKTVQTARLSSIQTVL